MVLVFLFASDQENRTLLLPMSMSSCAFRLHRPSVLVRQPATPRSRAMEKRGNRERERGGERDRMMGGSRLGASAGGWVGG